MLINLKYLEYQLYLYNNKLKINSILSISQYEKIKIYINKINEIFKYLINIGKWTI